jgi:hypothetical protein
VPIPFHQLDSELRALLAQAGFDPHSAVVRLSRELDAEHARNSRRYAWMTEDPLCFEFARATLDLDRAHRRGLLAHEVGHAIAILRAGDTSEEGADEAARRVLQIDIGYDHAWPGKGLQVSLGDVDQRTRWRLIQQHQQHMSRTRRTARRLFV